MFAVFGGFDCCGGRDEALKVAFTGFARRHLAFEFGGGVFCVTEALRFTKGGRGVGRTR